MDIIKRTHNATTYAAKEDGKVIIGEIGRASCRERVSSPV